MTEKMWPESTVIRLGRGLLLFGVVAGAALGCIVTLLVCRPWT